MASRNKSTPPVIPTTSGLGLHAHIVPLVRHWLAQGVSNANLKSSVRIEQLDELAGGLKSPVVGALSINVKAIIKQGTDELLLHQYLMNDVNARAADKKGKGIQVAVFPEVMAVDQLAGLPTDRNYLMIQQALVNYQSIQAILYAPRAANRERATNAIKRALPALRLIHDIKPMKRGALSSLPKTPDPFSERLASRLRRLKDSVPWLNAVFRVGARVDGLELPALDHLLPTLSPWQQRQQAFLDLRLVHGDPHLANLMARQRGPGLSVRWIDPNPLIGFSNPAYDWGKLLHFVEPVGWAKESARAISIRVTDSQKYPKIITTVRNPPKIIETQRTEIERIVRRAALRALVDQNQPSEMLELAIASAHIGYAALELDTLLPAPERRDARRQSEFALAHSLHALARWARATGQG